MTKSRFLSIFIFVYGLLAFIGASSFQDFYFELTARYSGQTIDYSRLAEFCGQTFEQYPWETDFDYRLRSARNMFAALCAMLVVANTAVIIVGGSIYLIFRITGAL